jgi:hypothetical protein
MTFFLFPLCLLSLIRTLINRVRAYPVIWDDFLSKSLILSAKMLFPNKRMFTGSGEHIFLEGHYLAHYTDFGKIK